MLIAKWKAGFESLYKADAQKVAEEIFSIGDSATPQAIVDKARDEATELHKCFTWDDTEAAGKWRQSEARQIVRLLVIKRPAEESKEPEVRVFYKTAPNEGYKPVSLVLRKESEYLAMLHRALGELQAFQKKYTILSDHEELRRLIDTVEGMIDAA